ncbi:MAG: conjugal transfer protein TraF [Bacilli bacterium]|nr:conjugal transfer protein TraF [Bacilli bacterium]
MKRVILILFSFVLFTGCTNTYKGYVTKKAYLEKGTKTYQNITFDEYKKKIENKDTFLLFVWQEGCSHCEAFDPTLKNVISNLKIKVYGIDLRSMSEEEYQVFKNKTFVTGTPSLVLINEGKYLGSDYKLVGDKSEDELLKFLNEIEVIKEA